MGRPPEEAEVRQIAKFAEKNLAMGKSQIVSFERLPLNQLLALCDSWLAQGRVIEAAREFQIRAEETNRRCYEVRARLVTGELSAAEAVTEYARATAPLAAALAAGGETETP